MAFAEEVNKKYFSLSNKDKNIKNLELFKKDIKKLNYEESIAALEIILTKYKKETEKFNYYCSNPEEINMALSKGASQARKVANEVLLRVRKNSGY